MFEVRGKGGQQDRLKTTEERDKGEQRGQGGRGKGHLAEMERQKKER